MRVPTGHFSFTQAAVDFSEEQYSRVAERNLRFVIESQNEDGSWNYSTDGGRGLCRSLPYMLWCLKALAKIEALTGENPLCTDAIARGVPVLRHPTYLTTLAFPKPFSRRPRLTVYRRELYDYAECYQSRRLVEGSFPGGLMTFCERGLCSQGLAPNPTAHLGAASYLIGWDNTPDASVGTIPTLFSKSLFCPASNHPAGAGVPVRRAVNVCAVFADNTTSADQAAVHHQNIERMTRRHRPSRAG